MIGRFLVAFLALTGAAAAASLDGASPEGRFATDAAGCKAQDYFLTVKRGEVILPTYSCKRATFDMVEDKGGRKLFAVKAKACFGEESTNPSPDAFKIALTATTAQILWKDGPSDTFVRCSGK